MITLKFNSYLFHVNYFHLNSIPKICKILEIHNKNAYMYFSWEFLPVNTMSDFSQRPHKQSLEIFLCDLMEICLFICFIIISVFLEIFIQLIVKSIILLNLYAFCSMIFFFRWNRNLKKAIYRNIQLKSIFSLVCLFKYVS